MNTCTECGKEFQPIRKGHLTCGPRCGEDRGRRLASDRYSAERAEIDQLRARVADLEWLYEQGRKREDFRNFEKEHEVFKRTPAQSLAKNDAAVLRTWAKNLRKIIVINAEDAADLTEQEADRIEQEAGL